jgi:hypothetical protein
MIRAFYISPSAEGDQREEERQYQEPRLLIDVFIGYRLRTEVDDRLVLGGLTSR